MTSLARHLNDLENAVAAMDAAALENLCRELEYEQIGKDHWPPEVFEFFIEALRNCNLSAMAGSASLVVTLYNDFDKLTPAQRESLLKELDNDADNFGDEMLRHAASDLVARLYPVSQALDAFIHWMELGSPHRLHMAQVGFEVLVMAKRLTSAEEARVRGYLRILWKRYQ